MMTTGLCINSARERSQHTTKITATIKEKVPMISIDLGIKTSFIPVSNMEGIMSLVKSPE